MKMRSESEMIEAMKQALKYTKQGALVPVDVHTTKLLLDALRAALAADTRICTCHPDDNPPKPCQRKYAFSECQEAALAEATIKDNLTVEPVAWISEVVCVGPNLGVKRYDKLPIQSLQPGFYKHTPLYTAPPKREPLTDEHLTALCRQHWDRQANILDHIAYARALERAHDIGGEE